MALSGPLLDQQPLCLEQGWLGPVPMCPTAGEGCCQEPAPGPRDHTHNSPHGPLLALLFFTTHRPPARPSTLHPRMSTLLPLGTPPFLQTGSPGHPALPPLAGALPPATPLALPRAAASTALGSPLLSAAPPEALAVLPSRTGPPIPRSSPHAGAVSHHKLSPQVPGATWCPTQVLHPTNA